MVLEIKIIRLKVYIGLVLHLYEIYKVSIEIPCHISYLISNLYSRFSI